MSAVPVLWIGRAEGDCVDWMRAAEEAGWRAEAFPLLQQTSLELSPEESEILHHLGADDCLFLTSKNGIRRLFELRSQLGCLPDCKYALIGTQSASLLAAGAGGLAGKQTDILAARRDGESLAQAYLQAPVSGRLVFFGAESPRPELAATLHEGGAQLIEMSVYRNEVLPGPSPVAEQPVLLFSPSSAESLAKRVDAVDAHPVVALGRTTEQYARDLGFPLFGRLQAPTPESLTTFLRHV